MRELAKLLIYSGIIIAAVGIVLWFEPKVMGLGRLPGDIYIKRDTFIFYFPLGTCILVSIIVTLILWFLRR